MVAGEGFQHVILPGRKAFRTTPFGHMIRQIADHHYQIRPRQSRRNFLHGNRPGAERLDHQSSLCQGIGLLDQRGDGRFRQINNGRNQQRLAGNGTIGTGLLEPLVNQPLMGSMLIHDHHPLPGLGEDVGLVELRPRMAKRRIRYAFFCTGLHGFRMKTLFGKHADRRRRGG